VQWQIRQDTKRLDHPILCFLIWASSLVDVSNYRSFETGLNVMITFSAIFGDFRRFSAIFMVEFNFCNKKQLSESKSPNFPPFFVVESIFKSQHWPRVEKYLLKIFRFDFGLLWIPISIQHLEGYVEFIANEISSLCLWWNFHFGKDKESFMLLSPILHLWIFFKVKKKSRSLFLWPKHKDKFMYVCALRVSTPNKVLVRNKTLLTME
jgi:hypothetical protein